MPAFAVFLNSKGRIVIMSDTPIVSTHSVQLVARPAEFCPTGPAADRFDASTARLTDRLGLKKLGCNITAVAAGRAAYPFHSHRGNDELFFVLAGSGELRLGSQRHAVKEGDLIGCPAGDASTAHQLVNTGSTELRYIAISTRIEPEVCEYPDSGKVGAYGGVGAGGFYHMARRGDQADYWDGE
jgi:uncharacterized cupin superfamily protein